MAGSISFSSMTIEGCSNSLQFRVKPGERCWTRRGCQLPVCKLWFFVNFTVIFHLLQDNPIFQNYRKQDERHRTV